MSRIFSPSTAQASSIFTRILSHPTYHLSLAMKSASQEVNTSDSGRRAVECVARSPWWGAYGPTVATNRASGIYVNSTFDSGNMDIVDIQPDGNVKLAIHHDPYCESDGREHFQWFFFRVSNVKDKPLSLRIVNAGDASYPEGWKGYRACCSYDRKSWVRVPTKYDEAKGLLTITHTPEHQAVYYAYFAPYSLDAHMHLVAEIQSKEQAELVMLGETLDGHDLDLLVFGKEDPGKKRIWIIARQHPGETMAEWFVEGMLRRLTDRHNAVARSLLQDAVVYVVPCMNPDGAWRGLLRCNAAGMNLNRCWQDPTLAESPEVYFTLSKMRQTGVDMLVDVHGDECIEANFIAYSEGIPGWTDKMADNRDKFSQFLKVANPDFQTVGTNSTSAIIEWQKPVTFHGWHYLTQHISRVLEVMQELGYPVSEPGQADMRKACTAVAQEFGCFAMTLEMPFKDCHNFPDEEYGWSAQRAGRFGASFLNAVRQIVPYL